MFKKTLFIVSSLKHAHLLKIKYNVKKNLKNNDKCSTKLRRKLMNHKNEKMKKHAKILQQRQLNRQ